MEFPKQIDTVGDLRELIEQAPNDLVIKWAESEVTERFCLEVNLVATNGKVELFFMPIGHGH